ncbi:MAG: hypothetical protein R2795_05855 [Saprospiraceae bacterium]
MTANQILVNSHFEYGALDTIIDYYHQQADRFSEDVSIKLYYTILMSLRHDDDPALPSVEIHAQAQHPPAFAHRAAGSLLFANNYCVRQINKGQRNFQKNF